MAKNEPKSLKVERSVESMTVPPYLCPCGAPTQLLRQGDFEARKYRVSLDKEIDIYYNREMPTCLKCCTAYIDPIFYEELIRDGKIVQEVGTTDHLTWHDQMTTYVNDRYDNAYTSLSNLQAQEFRSITGRVDTKISDILFFRSLMTVVFGISVLSLIYFEVTLSRRVTALESTHKTQESVQEKEP